MTVKSKVYLLLSVLTDYLGYYFLMRIGPIMRVISFGFLVISLLPILNDKLMKKDKEKLIIGLGLFLFYRIICVIVFYSDLPSATIILSVGVLAYPMMAFISFMYAKRNLNENLYQKYYFLYCVSFVSIAIVLLMSSSATDSNDILSTADFLVVTGMRINYISLFIIAGVLVYKIVKNVLFKSKANNENILLTTKKVCILVLHDLLPDLLEFVTDLKEIILVRVEELQAKLRNRPLIQEETQEYSEKKEAFTRNETKVESDKANQITTIKEKEVVTKGNKMSTSKMKLNLTFLHKIKFPSKKVIIPLIVSLLVIMIGMQYRGLANEEDVIKKYVEYISNTEKYQDNMKYFHLEDNPQHDILVSTIHYDAENLSYPSLNNDISENIALIDYTPTIERVNNIIESHEIKSDNQIYRIKYSLFTFETDRVNRYIYLSTKYNPFKRKWEIVYENNTDFRIIKDTLRSIIETYTHRMNVGNSNVIDGNDQEYLIMLGRYLGNDSISDNYDKVIVQMYTMNNELFDLSPPTIFDMTQYYQHYLWEELWFDYQTAVQLRDQVELMYDVTEKFLLRNENHIINEELMGGITLEEIIEYICFIDVYIEDEVHFVEWYSKLNSNNEYDSSYALDYRNDSRTVADNYIGSYLDLKHGSSHSIGTGTGTGETSTDNGAANSSTSETKQEDRTVSDIIDDYNLDLDIEDASSINNSGMTLYNLKEYDDAIKVFMLMDNIALNNSNKEIAGIVYYNLACTLSLQYDGSSSVLTSCLYYLEKSFGLRDDRVDRSIEDHDLDPVRNKVGYHNLMDRYKDEESEDDNVIMVVDDPEIEYDDYLSEAIAASSSDIDLDEPKSLNIEALKFYYEENYDYAISLLYRATKLDGETNDIKNLAMCYYNLACCLALTIDITDDASLINTLEFLERSFELRPDRITRAIEDTDFDDIRVSDRFLKLMSKYTN